MIKVIRGLPLWIRLQFSIISVFMTYTLIAPWLGYDVPWYVFIPYGIMVIGLPIYGFFWAEPYPSFKIDPPTTFAQGRARDLLLLSLDNKQRKTLLNKGYFVVRAGNGCFYRLRYTRHAPVARLGPRGRRRGSYCIVPNFHHHFAPREDVLLSIKLMLETDPKGFHLVAIKQ